MIYVRYYIIEIFTPFLSISNYAERFVHVHKLNDQIKNG